MVFSKYYPLYNIVRLLIICLVLLSPSLSKAEDKKSDSVNAWATAGLGFGSLGGFGVSASVNLRYKHLIIGARRTLNSDFTGDYNLSKCSSDMGDKALLLGVATKIFGPYVAVAIGISKVHGSLCRDFGFRDNVSLSGVPIDIQVLPKRRLGLAFRVFANINSTMSFGGFTLNLALGNLR